MDLKNTKVHTAMPSRRHDTLRGAALFALLGPPIGLATLVIAVNAFGRGGGGGNLLEGLWLMLLISYIFGVLPAAATGVLAGLLRRRYDRLEGAGMMALGGAGITAAILLLAATISWLIRGAPPVDDFRISELLSVVAAAAGIGAVSGAGCGLAFFNVRTPNEHA